MSLGEKLRQARLEAGLSQRALCADVITRNMLSQIENGNASPSMATLQYLAGRLEKPVSYFLEEAAQTEAPSALFAGITCLEQARKLLAAGKISDAQAALAQAQTLLAAAPDWVQRQLLLLMAQADPDQGAEFAGSLPSLDRELLLRAREALSRQDGPAAIRYLTAAEDPDPQWALCMGEALMLTGDFAQAAEHFHLAEAQFPHRTSQQLEVCYRELEDYQKAYFYACRVRNLTGK